MRWPHLGELFGAHTVSTWARSAALTSSLGDNARSLKIIVCLFPTRELLSQSASDDLFAATTSTTHVQHGTAKATGMMHEQRKLKLDACDECSVLWDQSILIVFIRILNLCMALI